jgi:acetoin utilization deacetylase AcuC-like enzyme
MIAIEQMLASRDWPGLEQVASSAISRPLLESVHVPAHVDAVERLCMAGGGSLDVDTVVSRGSWEAALHAAGAGVELVDLLLDGVASSGFSAHRPPGHHAERSRAMGFCLFNNIAVAARHALDSHRLERVAILDWDVHHGNGTSEIFWSTAAVLYVSIHESPLYPGTGSPAERGSGEGEGFTVNLPVSAGAGDALYSSLVDDLIVPRMREYAPQLVLVSAGYDAHQRDPLAGCQVTEAGYAAMTRSVKELTAELDVPLGFLLEGGYDLQALAESVAATLEVLVSDGHH